MTEESSLPQDNNTIVAPPPLLIVVPVVDPAPGPHDVRHLLQEETIVPLHDRVPLCLHLEFLQLQVEVHVGLRWVGVDHRLGVADLQCSRKEESHVLATVSAPPIPAR